MKIIKFLWQLLYAGIASVLPLVGVIVGGIYLYKGVICVGRWLSEFGMEQGRGILMAIFPRNEKWLTLWENIFSEISLMIYLLPIGFFLLLGGFVRSKVGGRFLQGFDELMTCIPGVGAGYRAVRQFMNSLGVLGRQKRFKSVVYVEYPSSGSRLIGFITGGYYDPERDQKISTVFIPTSPNPATGFVVLMEEKKLIHSALSIEEAGKLIVSAGLVHPNA